jgi:hypothetical protein
MFWRRVPVLNVPLPTDRTPPGRLPDWLRDAIDAVLVAAVLLTLALVAL